MMNGEELAEMLEARSEVDDEMLDHVMVMAAAAMEGIDDPDGRLTTRKIVEVAVQVGTTIAMQVITEHMMQIALNRSGLSTGKMN